MKSNSSFTRLIQSVGEDLRADSAVFSDYVLRINSYSKRKVKVLVVTGHNLHLLDFSSDTSFKHKACHPLSDIFCVEVAENNSILINITFNTQAASEMLECYRRSKLLAFFRSKNKVVSSVAVIQHRTNKKMLVRYDTAKNPFVKPEVQGLLEKARKAGVVKLSINRAVPEHFVLVLCDLGFLVLSVADLGTVHFCSLVGCRLVAVASERNCLQLSYADDAVLHTLFFETPHIQKEWLRELEQVVQKHQPVASLKQ